MDNVISGLVVLALSAVAAEEVPPVHVPKVIEQGAADPLQPVEASLPRLNGDWKVIEWPEMYKERYLERLDWRLGQLEDRLSLSPDQKGKAATWRKQVAKRLDTVKKSAEAEVFATPKELEVFLRPLLDEDQVAALAAFKKEEQTQFVASVTSRQVSSLEKVVGLKAEQQREVATAIAGEMQAVAAFLLDDPRPLGAFHSNYDKDPQGLGIEQLAWELWGERGFPLEREDPLRRRFSNELGNRIEARLASLKAVLTPEQLENYRQDLRKNWGIGWQQLLLPTLD